MSAIDSSSPDGELSPIVQALTEEMEREVAAGRGPNYLNALWEEALRGLVAAGEDRSLAERHLRAYLSSASVPIDTLIVYVALQRLDSAG